ncbi:MAG: AMP-binding protein [Actinomycetota bacterium]
MASLLELLRAGATSSGDQPALLAPGRRDATHRELFDQVVGVGDRLGAAGLGPDAPVALALPNGADLAVAFLGVTAAAVCAPLATDRPQAEHARDLEALGARAVIVQQGHDTAARDAATALRIPVLELVPGAGAGAFDLVVPDDAPAPAPSRDRGDAALLLFTSGTTSRPKLVPLCEDALVASAANVAAALGLTPRDRCLDVMPLFHIHGLVAGLLAPLSQGGSVICAPGFDAASVWEWIDTMSPTWYTAVPTIHQAMLDVSRPRATADRPIRSSLTFVRSSSAPLPARLMEELERVLGVPVIEAYGMTEAAHQIASNARPPGVRTPGSVGRAVGCEVVALGEDGRVLTPGAVGELAIRGPSVATQYLDAPEATAAAFQDGWFRTGDQGLVDADGVVTLTGRLKEIINRGGEKVAPRAIDDVLLTHPQVKHAVAFAVPHPRLGEEVGAAVVLEANATVTAPQLRRYAAERLAPYKVPRRVVAVDEIPRGATGKLDRTGLADRLGFTASTRAAPGAAPADDLEREIAAIWQRVLGDDELPSIDADFFDLGGDSLHATELLLDLERAFGRPLPATVFFDGATVRRMAALLRAEPADPSASFVVPVQPDGTRPPLFCVMRAGSVVTLRHLAATLGRDQPVFGVWMPSMHGPADAAGSIEEIATTCARLVREVTPDGPYRLFGHSLGAMVAYETACRLAAEGHAVEFVGIADAIHPDLVRARWAQRHSLWYRVRKLCSRRGPSIVAWRVRQLFGRNPPRPVEHLPGTGAVLDWAAAFARERGFTPGPAPALVTVFSAEPVRRTAGSADLGWARVATAGIECIEVPGDHDSMIGEPHVHVLAARLDECLRRAGAGGRVSPGGSPLPAPADGPTRRRRPDRATRRARRP